MALCLKIQRVAQGSVPLPPFLKKVVKDPFTSNGSQSIGATFSHISGFIFVRKHLKLAGALIHNICNRMRFLFFDKDRSSFGKFSAR